MKGDAQYTQHTVAFPTVELLDGGGAYDELTLGFYNGDGSSYGEFRLVFHKFDRSEPTVQLQVFADGWAALLAEPLSEAVHAIMKEAEAPFGAYWKRGMTPERAIEHLQAWGIGPSSYHTKGLQKPVTRDTA